jgi:hypothetical protein
MKPILSVAVPSFRIHCSCIALMSWWCSNLQRRLLLPLCECALLQPVHVKQALGKLPHAVHLDERVEVSQ